MAVLRTLVSALAYPLALTGAVLGIWFAMEAGVEEWMASGAVSLAGGALALALDRWLPYEPAWARSHGDVRADLLHTFVSGTVVEGVRLLLFAAAGALAVKAADWLGVGLWPTSWPIWAQLLLALLTMEFTGYWLHRLSHEVGPLWRLHSVHHSAPRIYVFNAFRMHPLDSILALLLQVVPLAFLGADARVVAMYLALVFVHAILQHSNADLRLGPLNWIFAGPELHRWHHSPRLREQKSNFGTVLIVWDALFGTRMMPPRKPPVDVGLGGLEGFPTGYLGQLAAPFDRRLWSDAAASDEDISEAPP